MTKKKWRNDDIEWTTTGFKKLLLVFMTLLSSKKSGKARLNKVKQSRVTWWNKDNHLLMTKNAGQTRCLCWWTDFKTKCLISFRSGPVLSLPDFKAPKQPDYSGAAEF